MVLNFMSAKQPISELQYIPFHVPSIDESDLEAMASAMKEGWLTSGRYCKEFESEFAKYVCSKFAITVSSGTAALLTALKALDLKPGDEIITTPFTFCSTVHAIIQAGGTPVLCDINRDDLQINVSEIKAKLSDKTRAILPVHYAGYPSDLEAILTIAKENNLRVIQDAAHALGTYYKGKPIGSYDDITCFSFYATKNITTCEGGMISVNDESLATKMRIIKSNGIDNDSYSREISKNLWYYEVVSDGIKANMADPLAALGISQLKRADNFRLSRQEIANQYNSAFINFEELEVPFYKLAHEMGNSWHLYPLRLNLEKISISRDEFVRELYNKGIATSVHFIPIPLHPYFQQLLKINPNDFPNALSEYERIFSLPIFPSMTQYQILRVINAIKDTLTAFRLN